MPKSANIKPHGQIKGNPGIGIFITIIGLVLYVYVISVFLFFNKSDYLSQILLFVTSCIGIGFIYIGIFKFLYSHRIENIIFKRLEDDNSDFDTRKRKFGKCDNLIKKLFGLIPLLIMAILLAAPPLISNFTEKSKCITPEIEIIYPNDSSKVEAIENIIVNLHNISNNYKPWIIIQPLNDNNSFYQPQPELELDKDGNWIIKEAHFGNPNTSGDVGHNFSIIAVVADKNAHEVYIKYVNKANQDYSYPGIQQLPVGTTIISTITVTRV